MASSTFLPVNLGGTYNLRNPAIGHRKTPRGNVVAHSEILTYNTSHVNL